jgi:hypothetical protein
MEITTTKIKATMIVASFWTISSVCVFSQTSSKHFDIVPKSVVYQNECGSRIQEMIGLLRSAKPDRPLIVISHLAKNESTGLGARRLHNAKTYLTSKYFDQRLNTNLIITAEGERTGQIGYVDFFSDGDLVLRILVENGKDLYLGDCGAEEANFCRADFDKQFFPCKRN